MREISGKVWGQTECIFCKNNVEVHRILVHPGTQCSLHCHQHKYNRFWVEEGTLTIKIWKNDYTLTDITTLHPGESVTVKPGEYHQFLNVHKDVVIAYEIYWTELDQGDIVRKDCGGLLEKLSDNNS